MDNAGYVSLARQAGLLREFNTIANNIANANTSGYRREGVIFSEHVKALSGGDPSMSIATMSHRFVDFSSGELRGTNNALDIAIDGDGFFLVEGETEPMLTRAGAFTLNVEGEIVTASGRRLLDEAGGALVIPQGTRTISVASDGAIAADGQPVGRLGVVVADPAYMVRVGDNMFRAEQGYQAAPQARVRQFALEGSNVSAVTEMAHLIEVQRAYEMGARFLQSEDERIQRTVRELGQAQ